MSDKPKIGSIGWIDLTVDDASEIRDFYKSVTGWSHGEVGMGEYSDYTMHTPADNAAVAGVCHKRGGNADLPSQWLIYITVANLDVSMDECKKRGGTVILGPKSMGPTARYCIIQDPVGAVAGLFEQS